MSNLPKQLYEFSHTFEYELLIELLLSHWKHPMASDEEFRNNVIEEATFVIKDAAEGKAPTGDLQSNEVNLVFAVWFVESSFAANEPDESLKKRREHWLATIKRVLPSCFCDQELLD